jgi:hypothetical protein
VQAKTITVDGLEVYDGNNAFADPIPSVACTGSPTVACFETQFAITAVEDNAKALTRNADANVFLIIRYSLS